MADIIAVTDLPTALQSVEMVDAMVAGAGAARAAPAARMVMLRCDIENVSFRSSV